MSEHTRLLVIRRALAATARSSLNLLTLQYPFSQVNLLTPEEFVHQAERRYSSGMSSRLHLDVAALEALHRHGALVPLLRVDLTTGDPACAENLIRPGGRGCSVSARAACAGCSPEVRSLRHDDRLCHFDLPTSVCRTRSRYCGFFR
jgi:hypothetical protein